MMTRVGLILSGCGYLDGAEIQETVLAMLALEEAGAMVECLAPAKAQTKVVNHQTGAEVVETRDVLVEAARIARGHVREVRTATPDDFDAVVLPGGFGAALNLSDFAVHGDRMTVDCDVERLLLGMHAAGKPIGALCIAPVILARLFGRGGVRLTIGNDPDTAALVERMGACHVTCSPSAALVDEANRLVTTPAYMVGQSAKDIYPGIRRLAAEVVRLARNEGQTLDKPLGKES